MDNVSILKFSLVKINSVLICSIRVSIKPFTFQQTDLVEESYTSIFDWQFWFSDSSKTCFWHCKILTFKLLFLLGTSLKSSIKIPKDTFLLVVQLCKKRLSFGFLGWVKREIDWKCSEISTFWLTSKFKPVLLQKVRPDFFEKDYNQKVDLYKVEFDWETKNFNSYTRNTKL